MILDACLRHLVQRSTNTLTTKDDQNIACIDRAISTKSTPNHLKILKQTGSVHIIDNLELLFSTSLSSLTPFVYTHCKSRLVGAYHINGHIAIVKLNIDFLWKAYQSTEIEAGAYCSQDVSAELLTMRLLTRFRLATLLAMIGLVHASNFWRLPCRNSLAVARMDPIMTPGKTCDHLHTIFGSGGLHLPARESKVDLILTAT